jgi:hypothetical protein
VVDESFRFWSEVDRDPMDDELATLQRQANRRIGRDGWEPEAKQ